MAVIRCLESTGERHRVLCVLCCKEECIYQCVLCLADKVHYVNGPGEVLHAFDAEAAEELSVYAGEEVRPNSQCILIHGQGSDPPVIHVKLHDRWYALK